MTRTGPVSIALFSWIVVSAWFAVLLPSAALADYPTNAPADCLQFRTDGSWLVIEGSGTNAFRRFEVTLAQTGTTLRGTAHSFAGTPYGAQNAGDGSVEGWTSGHDVEIIVRWDTNPQDPYSGTHVYSGKIDDFGAIAGLAHDASDVARTAGWESDDYEYWGGRAVGPARCISSPPTKALGRVVVPPGTTPSPPLPPCDAARVARARNSPATPGLEAQCRAARAQNVVEAEDSGSTPGDYRLRSQDRQEPPPGAPGAMYTPRAAPPPTGPQHLDAFRTDSGAPQYLELRCRGGNGLRFNAVEGRTNSSGEATDYLTVDFRPAAKAAQGSGLNLQPGQCAFPDRALRDDEPHQLVLEIVDFGQARQQLHGSPVDTSPTAAERYPDGQNLPQYMSDTRHYWSFFVRQNGPLPSGRFEASSAGHYWEPAIRADDAVRPIDPNRSNQSNPYVLKPK